MDTIRILTGLSVSLVCAVFLYLDLTGKLKIKKTRAKKDELKLDPGVAFFLGIFFGLLLAFGPIP